MYVPLKPGSELNIQKLHQYSPQFLLLQMFVFPTSEFQLSSPGLSRERQHESQARCTSRRQSFGNGCGHPFPLRQSFPVEFRTVLMICRRTWCFHMDKSKIGGDSKDTKNGSYLAFGLIICQGVPGQVQLDATHTHP